MARVTVIGAGIAGLASAALLARDGHDVQVLEALDRPGGRAGWIDDAGFRFDTGPSWYLMADVYEHFAELLGTSMDDLLDLTVLDPGYAIWRGGPEGADGAADDDASTEPPAVDRVQVPRGAAEVADLAESRESGAGAALLDYLDSARRALGISLADFLYNPFTSPASLAHERVLRAAPDLARWLSTSLTAWSDARVTDPLLRQMLQYPAIFLGVDPRQAPAIYHLMSHIDLVEGVRYPRGGFAAFVEALERLAVEAGARITYGADVEEILAARRRGGGTGVGAIGRAAGKAQVRGVRWRDREGRERRTRADVVVSAADLHHTETALLAPDLRTYPERTWERAVPGPSAVLVMLGVRGELPDLGHHTLLLTRDWETGLDAVFQGAPTPTETSLYVCKPSATDDGVAPAGHENLFVLVPVSGEIGLGRGTGYPGADQVADTRVEQIADAAVAQIAAWSGVTDLADRVVVRHTLGPADFGLYHSWKDGMLGPAHVLSQSALWRRGPRSRTVEGLYYAGGSATPGVGVPMCLISAEIVTKLLRGDQSSGPSSPVTAADAAPAAAAADVAPQVRA